MDVMDMQGKARKQDVQYRKAETESMCANCSSYLGEDECVKVFGVISAGMVCDLWTGNEPLVDNSDMEDMLYVG